jgi:RNA polymerase sigma factor (sigma-70 family)
MGDTTIGIQACLARLRDHDASARDELIALACQRLTVLASKLLNRYERLRRFEQTDDVAQNAALRLHRALADVQPRDPAEFFGLAALKIRQELQDLTRHYFGREGQAAPRAPDRSPAHAISDRLGADDQSTGSRLEAGDSTYDPAQLAQWTEFHRVVESLPDKERQVVDLLFYHGLSQAEAADVLAVDASTVKRRWRSARLALHDLLKDSLLDL